MKKLDILENQVKYAYLAIGSNLGSRELNIQKAKILLENYKIKIIKCSSFYETKSWPDKIFPKYLNIVVKIATKINLFNLFKIIKLIEKKLGRKKNLKNYPRICDIDIIDYDKKCHNTHINKNTIEVPHPRMKGRNFVLVPLFEISSNWIHPKTKENISKLLSKISLEDLSSIKLI